MEQDLGTAFEIATMRATLELHRGDCLHLEQDLAAASSSISPGSNLATKAEVLHSMQVIRDM